MKNEEAVKEALIKKFGLSENLVRIQRTRRIFVDDAGQDFARILDFASGELGFSVLCAITGLDDGARYEFIYHLARPKGEMLNIKIYTPRDNSTIRTITGKFPGAEIFERELVDLLGVKVDGLGEGNRYPLSDDWPKGEYPLRKDWVSKNKKAEDK